MTRGAIIREFLRLCDLVSEAETYGLLDMDEALAMRERYRERCDELLAGLDRQPVRV